MNDQELLLVIAELKARLDVLESSDFAEVLPLEVLKANVRVKSGNAGGSGTVLYSRTSTIRPDECSTYILTNHHVVENNIKIDKKWDALLKREIKTDKLGTVEAHFFGYEYGNRAVGGTVIEANIVAYDVEEDLALLKLKSTGMIEEVATMYPREEEKKLKITRNILAIGAGMGEKPVTTGGFLSQFGCEIDNREFWLSTAPTIFGNSGGAVYLKDTHEFIGVPSRIDVAMLGFSTSPITHLSFMIPINRVYDFFENQMFRFMYDNKFTEKGELEARDAKRKDLVLKMAAKEFKGEDSDEVSDDDENVSPYGGTW